MEGQHSLDVFQKRRVVRGQAGGWGHALDADWLAGHDDLLLAAAGAILQQRRHGIESLDGGLNLTDANSAPHWRRRAGGIIRQPAWICILGVRQSVGSRVLLVSFFEQPCGRETSSVLRGSSSQGNWLNLRAFGLFGGSKTNPRFPSRGPPAPQVLGGYNWKFANFSFACAFQEEESQGVGGQFSTTVHSGTAATREPAERTTSDRMVSATIPDCAAIDRQR